MTPTVPQTLFAWCLLITAVAWSFFPTLLVVLSSFKPAITIFDFPPRLIFRPTLTNYVDLLRNWPEIITTLRNSTIITGAASLLGLLLSLPAAYAYSRYRGRFLAGSAFLILAVRIIPPILLTIPLFPFLEPRGLIDKQITLIVLYAALNVSLTTWLMKSFIDEVPREIEEAAMLDGCGALTTLMRVTLPLAVGGLVAAAVFAALVGWNEFAFALVFTSTKARTAPVLLNEMLGSVTGIEWGPLFAAATLQLAPMLAFVWAVQKYLIRGMTVGSVKG